MSVARSIRILASIAILLAAAAHAQQYTVTNLGTVAGQSGSNGVALNGSGQVTGYLGPLAPPGNPSAGLAFLYSNGALQDLGTLGGPYSVGLAINASGQVTGSADTATGGHAFLYSSGAMQDLGTLGGTDSEGNAINDSGQVTGFASTGAIYNGTCCAEHAFLYSKGTLLDLGTLGGTNSEGLAINDDGQVTGVANRVGETTPGTGHAFLYSDGMMQDLGALVAGATSSGVAINASGQVTGFSGTTTGVHAFLYGGGSMQDLGILDDLGTSSYSYPTAINASGQVAGYSLTATGNHAFLYSNGSMHDLGTLGGPPGGGASLANAINDSGQVTGVSTTGTFPMAAFLYSDGRMVDLNSQIGSAAALYTLLEGVAINDRGQIVANGYVNATGQEVAFLLTPVGTSVPNVVGDTQASATSALTTAGFMLGAVATQASTTVAPGLVISQDPGAEASAPAGSAVSLIVSSGVAVPNVVGVSLALASDTLISAGLTTGSIAQEYSGTLPLGDVISESPAAGSSVAGGTAINLVISEGPTPVLTQVPNVIGDKQSAAAAALTAAGLTLGHVGQQASETVPAGEVSSQSPASGDSVAVGSAVDAVLSSGPPRMSIGLSGPPQFAHDGSAWVVTIGIQNNGNVTADEIEVLSLSLSGALPLSGAGQVVESVAPGSASSISVTFPVTVSSGVLRLSGTYMAGTLGGNWSVAARVAVPAAP
jgi:probable HAF family extracellular repeat protein